MMSDVLPLARVPCPPGSRVSISWGPGNTISLAPVVLDRLGSNNEGSSNHLETVSTVRWYVLAVQHGLVFSEYRLDEAIKTPVQGATCCARATSGIRLPACIQGPAHCHPER